MSVPGIDICNVQINNSPDSPLSLHCGVLFIYFVHRKGFTIDLAVEGAKARNRAFDQDWVVVRVEENRARWRTTTAYDDADKTTKAEKSNKADKATNEPAAPAVASGRITAADLDHAFNAAGERLQATAEVVYIDPQSVALYTSLFFGNVYSILLLKI